MNSSASRVPLIVEPDPDDPGCAMVLVDGTVAGHPYRFMLDTGAPRTQIEFDDFTAELPSHGEDRSAGVFAASTDDLVTLPDVSVGTVTAADLEVSRADPTHIDAQNLLGMDVLGTICCAFDFEADELLLTPSGSLPDGRLLSRSPRGHAFVEVQWQQVSARACWDSGAGITLVDAAFFADHHDFFTVLGSSTGTDATGARAETPTYLMTGATIGEVMFAAHLVAVVDLPQTAGMPRMDLILGYPTLSQANWVFDFPANRWDLSAVEPPPG
ncbi:MAG: retropepsin-like aspartic protease [Jatrophihabitans sp.]